MMGLWADYLKERLNWDVLECDDGFIAYNLKPPEASIEDFYIKPDKRCSSLAKKLADQVFDIAKKSGCKRMWAKITPGLKGCDHAMKTNLHYGFKIVGIDNNQIVIMKEIRG